MPKCTIDGKEVEFTPGENLIEVAKRVGSLVPYFCYHPGLSVVAQCRMCTVEIDKMPKLQTACSTPAQEGMVVRTQSQRAKDNQKSVMEFLLVNHPLDCPICDKAGECDLQDYSYKHGDAYMRTSEDRRTYVDLDMGPVIKKNMNRCIHCTRCIRFGDEVAKVREMVAVNRGNNTEITTVDGRALETEYAGNYSDICPTGSLTLNDFRFKKRAWMLKKTNTVCEGCSTGCNMEIQQDANVIYRCVPRENLEINRYWMCDEGRFNFHYLQNEDRVLFPHVAREKLLWSAAVRQVKSELNGKKILFLVGTDLTLEEMKLIQEFSRTHYQGSDVQHFGTAGVPTVKDDAAEDFFLKRKSKTSNLNGAEKLGLKPYAGSTKGFDAVVVFRGGRAELPELGSTQKYGFGVFQSPEVADFSAVLPGLGFAEKDGTIVNFQGKEQKLKKSVHPAGDVKALSEFLMMMVHSQIKVGAA